MPPPPDITLADLGVRAPDRWILRGFSLEVFPGEKVALTGPSGAGKSTVLRAVLGLAMAAEGSVSIRGTPVDDTSCWALRRHLAWVAQEPALGDGTVRAALERPFSYRANQDLRGNLERVPALMERFSLKAALLDDGVDTLSGGEKQRVALVSALLLDRPILLLDEASSALDPENARAVADFLQAAEDLTVLSISHDTGWAAFSDRTVALTPVPTQAGAAS